MKRPFLCKYCKQWVYWTEVEGEYSLHNIDDERVHLCTNFFNEYKPNRSIDYYEKLGGV